MDLIGLLVIDVRKNVLDFNIEIMHFFIVMNKI
jgi:hypothetical protein